jgi:hypothetical protein
MTKEDAKGIFCALVFQIDNDSVEIVGGDETARMIWIGDVRTYFDLSNPQKERQFILKLLEQTDGNNVSRNEKVVRLCKICKQKIAVNKFFSTVPKLDLHWSSKSLGWCKGSRQKVTLKPSERKKL